MSHRRVNALLCLILALSALVIGGCGQGSYGKEYYILDVIRNAGPSEVKGDETLEVRRFNIGAAFASRNMIYRLGQFQYEPDYYHQFLIAPATMVTEETRHWLADSGLFKQVLPSASQVTPTYSLQGIITALYGDFTDKATPTAVVRIRFFLMQHQNGGDTIIFSQAYKAAAPLPDRTGRALIDAFSKDMVDILTHFEADLGKFLSGKTEGSGTS
jgi:ABC-type uncharacterized transport system auxiliary subunit